MAVASEKVKYRRDRSSFQLSDLAEKHSKSHFGSRHGHQSESVVARIADERSLRLNTIAVQYHAKHRAVHAQPVPRLVYLFALLIAYGELAVFFQQPRLVQP